MRWTVKSEDNRQMLTINPRRDLFVTLFLVWWIALWVVGEVTLINVMAGGLKAVLSGSVPNTISTFRYMWPLLGAGLVGWTVIGAAMIYALLWELLGIEEVTVDVDALSVHRRIVIVSTEKSYPRKTISGLRFDAQAGWWLSHLEYWGLAGGKLAFESSGKTVRLGRTLDESSAKRIAGQLGAANNEKPTS